RQQQRQRDADNRRGNSRPLRRLKMSDQRHRATPWLHWQLSDRNCTGTVVRLTPTAVITAGAAALPQTQVTGTTGASSTTAGRSVSTLSLIRPLARLPKVM